MKGLLFCVYKIKNAINRTKDGSCFFQFMATESNALIRLAANGIQLEKKMEAIFLLIAPLFKY